MEKECNAIVISQDGDALSIVLFKKGEKDWKKSVNALMVKEGLASIRKGHDDYEEVAGWHQMEEEAKEAQLKIWQYGGAGGDSDYE